MRVAFFGTPTFAVATLEAVAASSHAVAGVVTQPDRPRGRGHKVMPSPVKVAAHDLGVPVLQPERLKDEAFLAAFDALEADIAVVAAYGKLLPQVLLDRPRLGMINVHASLLPRWRGAAPIHRAILAGDADTGVTIMRVVLALDAGPMLSKVVVPISGHDTSVGLERELASAGARVLVSTLDALSQGAVAEVAQDETLVTYAERLERADSQIDWSTPAEAIHNKIRGLQPWPLAAAVVGGRRLRFWESRVSATPAEAPPGTIVAITDGALVVATGQGHVQLTQVQPDGRSVMPVAAYLHGHALAVGDRFGPLPIE